MSSGRVQPLSFCPESPAVIARRAEIHGILRAARAQAKQSVGQSNDKYEQKTDHVAEQVTRMSNADVVERVEAETFRPSRIQRRYPECEGELAQRQPAEDEGKQFQRMEKPCQTLWASSGIGPHISSLTRGGRPLDSVTRTFFEPRFGHDFGQVRVHTGNNASEAAESVNARAFTLGRDIVFRAGEYQPGSTEGRRLLGHELTHVLQQRRNVVDYKIRRKPIDESPSLAKEAFNQGGGQRQHKKVLITGFNDWQNLGTPPNVWICKQNPSCRLLTGNATTNPPTSYAGPLVSKLRGSRNVTWEFKTMPTTWGVAARMINYQHYDAVINMGLGVYHTRDAIQLEQNAYNERVGADAAGNPPPLTQIDPSNTSTTLTADSRSGVNRRTSAMNQAQVASQYTVRVRQARQNNNFICNETHYHALSELNRSMSANPQGRLKLVYFIHLPYPRATTGYSGLASGTAEVIKRLIR